MTNPLTRQLGPLAVWQWAGALVVGVVLWRFMSGKKEPEVAETTWDYGTVLDGGSGGQTWGTGGSGGASLISDGSTGFTTPGGTPSITSNDMWGRIGADYLTSLGADPIKVSQAIGKYFMGTALDATDQSIINQLIRHFGNPPEGIIPAVVNPTTPTTPTPGTNRYPGNPRPTATTTFVIPPGPPLTWVDLLRNYPPGSTNDRALKMWHSTHGGNPIYAGWTKLGPGLKIRLPIGSPGMAG